MNILAVPITYGLSKPISGGQNRFRNLVEQLKKKDNTVIILESQDFMDSNDKELAKFYTYTDIKFFSRALYVLRDINIDFTLKFVKILKNESINTIQISHPSGIFVAKLITKLMRKKIPIVYDAHNVESDIINYTFANNQKYSKLERLIIPIYIKFLEKLVCKYIVNHITSVSYEDRMRFIEKYGINEKEVTVIPSGVNIIDLRMLKDKNEIKKEFDFELNKLIIIFHGSYFYLPNTEAIDLIKNYIAPEMIKINKDISFIIAGSDVPIFKRDNIKSIGFVEDIYTLLQAADIAIAPLLGGGGTKLKILDYMSVGLPVVTTKKGIEGLNAKNGEHAIIVDDVNEEFISAIKYLVDNEQERKKIGVNARRLAEEKYDWNKIGEKLDKLFKEILDERKHANK